MPLGAAAGKVVVPNALTNKTGFSPKADGAEVPANAMHLGWVGPQKPLVPQGAYRPAQRGWYLAHLDGFLSAINFFSQSLIGPSSVRCDARRIPPFGCLASITACNFSRNSPV